MFPPISSIQQQPEDPSHCKNKYKIGKKNNKAICIHRQQYQGHKKILRTLQKAFWTNNWVLTLHNKMSIYKS